MMEATGDRKSSKSEKHFIAHLNGGAWVSPVARWENHITDLYTGSLQRASRGSSEPFGFE